MASVYKQGIGKVAYKLQDGGTIPGDTLSSILDEQLANKFAGDIPVVERTPKTGDVDALFRKYVPPHLREAFGRVPAMAKGVATIVGPAADIMDMKHYSGLTMDSLGQGNYSDALANILMTGAALGMTALPGSVGGIDRAVKKLGVDDLPLDTPEIPSYLPKMWKESTGLEPEDVALLYKTGDSQRGFPERAMVNFQAASGGGVQSYVFEHLGDLTDRMSARHNPEWAQAAAINKIDKVLRTLESPHGFRKEITKNAVNNWKFKASSDKTLSFEAYTNKLNDLSLRYAEEHSKIPVYTEVHRLANEATIQNAKGNHDIAAGLLRELRNRIDTKDKFFKEVSKVDRSGTPAITEKELRGYGGGPADPLPLDTASRMKRAEEMRHTVDAYHGTARIDRLLASDSLDKGRATSGPMAFFSSDPSVASGYALTKADTSRLIEDAGGYENWFKYTNPSGNNQPFTAMWERLPQGKRAELRQAFEEIGQDWDTGEIVRRSDLDNVAGASKSHWDWTLKEHKGNALEAAKDIWLDSGNLYDQEEGFMKVLDLAGVEGVKFDSPYMRAPGVLPVKLRIENPFETTPDNVKELIPYLEDMAPTPQGLDRSHGVDMWDKNTMDSDLFIERLKDDVEEGTTFAWTSIPDWVTDALRQKGYDSIKDLGGKNMGVVSDVYIPFDANQVRSRFAEFDPAKKDLPGLNMRDGGVVRDPGVYGQGIGKVAYKLQDGGTIPGDTLPSILDEQLANKFVGAEPDVVVERTPKTGDVDALIRKYVPPHLREAFSRTPATAEGIASVIGPAADVQDMKNYSAATMNDLRAGDYLGSLANLGMTGAAFGMMALPGSVGGIDKAVKRITPAKEDLPMDTASRMKRMEEMGYDTSRPLYHATLKTGPEGKGIEAFIPSQKGGRLGPGVYFSPRPGYSGRFAKQAKEGSNVIPTYVRGNLAKTADIDDALKTARERLNKQIGSNDVSEWKALADEILKERGFVGKEFGEEIVVFDPKNIRSLFAEFDPAKKDLPGLSMRDGGVVPGPRSVSRETRPTVFSTGIPTALRRVR